MPACIEDKLAIWFEPGMRTRRESAYNHPDVLRPSPPARENNARRCCLATDKNSDSAPRQPRDNLNGHLASPQEMPSGASPSLPIGTTTVEFSARVDATSRKPFSQRFLDCM